MKKNCLLLFSAFLCSILFANAQTPDASGIVYVTPNGTGNGSHWNTPTSNLQGAINAAGVTKVFVAIGNYDVPSPNSFVMKSGVAIYGGFDPASNIKTLNDNRILPNKGMGDGSVLNGKNERTIIWNDNNAINPLTAPAILDGFTIANGYTTEFGGGIYNYNVTPKFNNLVIRDNIAERGGGGMVNYMSAITLSNSIIRNNKVNITGAAGGAMQNAGTNAIWGGSINITNTVLRRNFAPEMYENGVGIIYSNGAEVNLTNVLIPWGNVGTFGIVQTGGKPLTMNNVTMAGQSMVAPLHIEGASLNINNSLIYARLSTGDGGSYTASYSVMPNSYSDNNCIPNTDNNFTVLKVFTDPNNDNYTLKSTSPISPAINRGSNALYGGLNASSTDVIGNRRLVGHTIDLGAYEAASGSNITPDNGGIVYVRTSEYGNKSGNNWNNATNDLYGAIHTPGVQKVFVATGTYNAELSFEMKNGVEIYGGFDPGAGITDLSHKRWMPDASNPSQGSILNGLNARTVIYNSGGLTASAVLDGFTITGGSASIGAGIYNHNSSPTLRNLVIRNNAATVLGGGMYNNASSPAITNTVFSSNSVVNPLGDAWGGAVFNSNSSAPVLSNVTMVGNTVRRMSSGTERGAGIYNDNSSPKIYNSIIWNNTKVATGETSGADIQNSGSITVTLKNSITQNYTTGDAADNNLINVNPLFVNANSGNYVLQVASPAIDAGNNSFYAGLTTDTKDLAGNLRLSIGKIDIGAYEYQLNITPTDGIVYVKPTASGSGNGSNWANATSWLHYAIDATGVQKVYVAVGNYNVGSSSFIMKNGVEIYGGFNPTDNTTNWNTRTLPNKGTGDGSVLNGQNTRPVIWNNNNGLNNTALLDGFTLMNGKGEHGAAIFNSNTAPAFNNLLIKNNTASISGGAIYNVNSPIKLSNALITNNTAQYGGGIRNNSSAAEFTNVSITNNSATLQTAGAGGGGIFNENSALKLTNVLIANNSTQFQGGGFRNLSGNPVFTNVTLANNTAYLNYTGIEIAGGNPQINNSIILGINLAGYTPKYSLIHGNTNFANGNINPTGIISTDIFTNPSAGDYTLKNGSVAVNAGDNSLNSIATDLVGNARVYNLANGGIIDLGAYESSFNSPLAPDANGIIYVIQNGAGNGSGKDWDNATNDLQGAIDATGTQKVFVAIGNYNAPAASFIMKNDVEIYGGFDPANGIATLAHSRILPTELVGGSVLNGQNARPIIYNDNNGLTATAILDGFTLTNGKGNNGGAMYNLNGSPIFNNLVIKNNTALTSGGAIYNLNSPIKLNNTIITGNTAQYGGGVRNNSSHSEFTNVIIKNNSATMSTGGSGGGGIFNELSNLKLTNVLIANNSTQRWGGGFRNLSGNPVFTNVTLANNTAVNQTETTAMEIAGGTSEINNSIIYGTTTGTYTPQYSLIQGNADFDNGNINPSSISETDIFNNPSAGDYTLKSSSAVVNAGNNILFTGLDANTKDLAGNARVYNNGVIDLGAYEYQGNPAVLPVTLLNFTAKADGNQTKLQWQTASELNNKGFEIYRSGEDGKFVKIGDVRANYHFSYTFLDNTPLNGNNYYQLIQIDNDGKETDLDVRTVNFSFASSYIQLYPNPTADLVTLSFAQSAFTQLQVIDINGRVLQESKLNATESSKQVSLGIYPLGTYIIKLSGNEKTESRRVVKR